MIRISRLTLMKNKTFVSTRCKRVDGFGCDVMATVSCAPPRPKGRTTQAQNANPCLTSSMRGNKTYSRRWKTEQVET